MNIDNLKSAFVRFIRGVRVPIKKIKTKLYEEDY